MKKLILSIVLSAVCLLTLSAARSPQSDGNSVSVTDTEVVVAAENVVSVSFQLHVGSEVTARNRSMIIRPVLLSGGGHQIELPPIIVRGEKAKTVAESRAMVAAGVNSEGRFVTGNGTTLEYFAQIAWQNWMAGSQLVFNGLGVGKGVPTEVTIGTVADGLLVGETGLFYPTAETPFTSIYSNVTTPAYTTDGTATTTTPAYTADNFSVTTSVTPAAPAYTTDSFSVSTPTVQANTTDGSVVVPAPVVAQNAVPGSIVVPAASVRTASVGDELAARFAFVEPVERYWQALNASSSDAIFDYNMPILFGKPADQPEDEVSKFVEMTREGALNVQFESGSVMPSRAMGQNNAMLVDMLSSLRILIGSSQTRVSQVVVVGFSAPEGTAEEKETLALERAGVVRDVILANLRGIDPSVISIYNGAVDWATLRALVAGSNIPDKYEVLDLIDNVPEWGNTRDKDRLAYLQELNNGAAFRYIRENFFSQLRQTGAYVKIYYENVQ